MTGRKTRFQPEELDRVANAVAAAEAGTSGEIVPVILPASQDYSWLASTIGVRVALITLAFVEVLNLFSWPLSWSNTFGLVISVTLVSMALTRIPAVARKLLGEERLDRGVIDRTRALFIQEGVTETKNRTGVLIFVSEFEHEISILADQGIHAKLPPTFWRELCQEFVGLIREKGEIDALCKVIERVGSELTRYFPRIDAHNELPDGLRGKGTP